MNIVYLDSLFFVNFICDYIIMLCSAKLSGAAIRRIPFLIASSLGSTYACICVIFGNVWFSTLIVKYAAMILICLIAFGKETQFAKCCIAFFLISAMVGGLITAIQFHPFYFLPIPFHIKHLAIYFIILYIILSLYFHTSSKTQHTSYHNVKICFNGKESELIALEDTGNTLYDPITNLPVMICDSALLEQLFCFHVSKANTPDNLALFNLLSEIPELKHKVKLIPYQTIDNNGFMAGLKPDSVYIDSKQCEIILAFRLGQFSHDNEYQAIF